MAAPAMRTKRDSETFRSEEGRRFGIGLSLRSRAVRTPPY
jgi:hypothetical protein